MTAPSGRPPEAEWTACAQSAENAVLTALSAALLPFCNDRYHRGTTAAGLFAAIAAVTEIARGIGDPSGYPVMEEYLVAYVRGGMRGAEGPIHNDGRPYEGTARA